jgi:hypothetical protein
MLFTRFGSAGSVECSNSDGWCVVRGLWIKNEVEIRVFSVHSFAGLFAQRLTHSPPEPLTPSPVRSLI